MNATHHTSSSSPGGTGTIPYGVAGSSSTGGGGNDRGGGSSSSGGGGGGHQYPSSNHGPGPCGACKFLRRKCVAGCIFAPYFDSDQGAAHFAAVHKVFGASNVSKLLLHIPAHRRLDAVVTICYEAQARLRDPVHGCVAHIFNLQQQVMNLQTELTYLHAHLSSLEVQIPPPHQTLMLPPQQLSISDLPPPSSSLPTTYDLTSLFDPLAHQPPPPPPPPPLGLQSAAWASSTMQQHHGHMQHTVTDPMNDDQPAAGASSSSSMSRMRD